MMTIYFTRTLYLRLSEIILLLSVSVLLTLSYSILTNLCSSATHVIPEQENHQMQSPKQKEAVAGSLAHLRLRAGMIPVLKLPVVHQE